MKDYFRILLIGLFIPTIIVFGLFVTNIENIQEILPQFTELLPTRISLVNG